MTKIITVNGLTTQQHTEVLSKSIKVFGKDTVSNGIDTLDINIYMSEIIDGFSNKYNNEKNLKRFLGNIDLYINVEDGNLIYNGNSRYRVTGNNRDNKFSNIYNKICRDVKKQQDCVNPEKISKKEIEKNKKEIEKEKKKKWIEELKSNIKIGNILVSESNSRSVFYTVVNIYFTKQNKVKSVDVRYTDSDETAIQGYQEVTPGKMRLGNDIHYLYKNCPITVRGVIIEKNYSGGVWDTIGIPYEKNKTYTYDSYA